MDYVVSTWAMTKGIDQEKVRNIDIVCSSVLSRPLELEIQENQLAIILNV